MPVILRGRSIRTALPVPVRISTPDIEIFDLGRTVDRVAMQKGTHRLIVGRLTGGCCGSLLRARLKDGFVVGIEVERCKESAPVDRRIAGVLQRAVRTLARRARRGAQPVPVREFLNPTAMKQIASNLVVEHCFKVCITTIGGPEQCYLCCTTIWSISTGGERPKRISRWCLPF
jgi:hypothetical protein